MLSLVLSGLERVLNAHLRLDSDALSKIAALDKKVVKITIEDWEMSFFIVMHQDGIELTSRYYETPDAALSSTLNNLFLVMVNQGSSKTLFKNPVSISGDIELAQSLQKILASIDIDWEEHLSKYTGDTLAYHLGKIVTKTKEWFGDAKINLAENITEYLQKESEHLPTRQEVDQFIAAVNELRHGVERLEVRFQQLKE